MINEPLENAKEIASITGSIMREKPEPDDESRLILTEQRGFLKNIETGEESNSIPLNEVYDSIQNPIEGGYTQSNPYYSESKCYFIFISDKSHIKNISLDVKERKEEAEDFLKKLGEAREAIQKT